MKALALIFLATAAIAQPPAPVNKYSGGVSIERVKGLSKALSDMQHRMDSLAAISGSQGPQGIQGPVGAKGNVGNTGATGAQGPQGVAGATGPQGVQGPKGDTGATGAQGIQGPQGSTGPQGATGPAGASGVSSLTATATQTLPLIAVGGVYSFTVPVAGATTGMVAVVNYPAGLLDNLSSYSANIETAGVVTIRLKALVAITAGPKTFTIRVIQ